MLRMEIALFLVLGFVAYSYFSAEKKFSQLHSTFSMLLAVVLCHLVFNGITVYMDINIPIMNGLKVIQCSRAKHPEIAFVIVSGYPYAGKGSFFPGAAVPPG